MVAPVVVGILSASLALLAAGRLSGRIGYLLQSAGWAVMACFWGVQTVFVELIATDNASNAFFTGMAAAFSLYLSLHAFNAWALDVESRPLRFMAGMAVISSVIYYPFEWSTAMAGGIVQFVAVQTAWSLTLLGYSATAGGVHVVGSEVYVPIEGTKVSIILACTAIQAFAIFGGAIASTHAPPHAKARALLVSIVPIHLLNIVRNVGIIVLVTDHGFDFDVAHSGIGKFFSLIVLIVILYYIFTILPGLYDDIIGVLTLGEDIGGHGRGGSGVGMLEKGGGASEGIASPHGPHDEGVPSVDEERDAPGDGSAVADGEEGT